MVLRRARSTAAFGLVLVALAAAQAAAGATAAPATTEPVQIMAVNVAVTADRVRLDHTGAGFDNTVQFRIRNGTPRARTFAIGGQKVRIPARAFRVLLVYFHSRGKYPYAVTPGPKTTYRGVFRIV